MKPVARRMLFYISVLLLSPFSHALLFFPFLSFFVGGHFLRLYADLHGSAGRQAEFAVCLPAPRGSSTLAVKPGLCG